jgi:hypothetical protein
MLCVSASLIVEPAILLLTNPKFYNRRINSVRLLLETDYT